MTKIVFFDTDCLSSFLWIKTEYLLTECLGPNLVVSRQFNMERKAKKKEATALSDIQRIFTAFKNQLVFVKKTMQITFVIVYSINIFYKEYFLLYFWK